MKKQLIKSICLALLACGMMQTATAQGIVVNRKDGKKVYYKASDVESVGVYGYGEGPYDGGPRDYVEIGGLKWATMNVGAITVADSYETCYGDYFAWGETEPRYMTITRTGANRANFTWKNGYSSGYSSDNPPAYTDRGFDAAHDVATDNWGGSWRIPTLSDITDLYEACTGIRNYEQTPISLIKTITEGGIYWLTATQTYEPEYTGVAGVLFVGASDISKRVFFPASGYVGGTSLEGGGTIGRYMMQWVEATGGSTFKTYYLHFDSSKVVNSTSSSSETRYVGYTVRPVSD